MGLVTAQLWHRHHGSIAKTAQLHRGSTAAVADHRQPLTTAAQRWLLLTAGEQTSARPFTASVAADQRQAGQQDEQRAAQVTQSSKRELLSRGLPDEGRELRGGWRLLEGRFEANGGSLDRRASEAAPGLALGLPRLGDALRV